MKRFLLLWLVGASLIAFVLGSVNIPRLFPLTRRGVETCGTITAFEPNNHRTVHYSFQVNGKTYSGAQEGGVGEKVLLHTDCMGYVVFYLPDDPYVSCIGDPVPMLNNEVISILLPMLIFPPSALLGWRWRYPKFRRWLKAELSLPTEKDWDRNSESDDKAISKKEVRPKYP
jgi:hypothetical protein